MATIRHTEQHVELLREEELILCVRIEPIGIITRITGLQNCAYKFIYDEPCSLCEDLAELTRYIREHIPQITHLRVNNGYCAADTTYPLSYQVSSNNLSFAFTGTTVFESKFQAICHTMRSEQMDEYRTHARIYTSIASKSNVPFISEMMLPFLSALHRISFSLETVETIFHESQTWMEFVKKIDQTLKKEGVSLEDRYMFYKDWLSSFVYQFVDVPYIWIWKL